MEEGSGNLGKTSRSGREETPWRKRKRRLKLTYKEDQHRAGGEARPRREMEGCKVEGKQRGRLQETAKSLHSSGEQKKGRWLKVGEY